MGIRIDDEAFTGEHKQTLYKVLYELHALSADDVIILKAMHCTTKYTYTHIYMINLFLYAGKSYAINHVQCTPRFYTRITKSLVGVVTKYTCTSEIDATRYLCQLGRK